MQEIPRRYYGDIYEKTNNTIHNTEYKQIKQMKENRNYLIRKHRIFALLGILLLQSFKSYSQTLTITSGTTTITSNASYSDLALSGGSLVINSPAIVTFSGAFAVSNSATVSIQSGASVTVGSATFSNTSSSSIQGTFTCSGDFTLSNNASVTLGGTNTDNISGNVTLSGSGSPAPTLTVGSGVTLNVSGNVSNTQIGVIVVEGTMAISGNYASSNTASIGGTGSLTTVGSMNTSNSSTIFGITPFSCSSGCSGRDACSGFDNSIITSSQGFCTGSTTLAINATSVASATYTWELSTSSSSSGFSDIVGETGEDIASLTLVQTTWVRRKVVFAGCTEYSNVVKFSVATSSATATLSGSQTICAGYNTPVSISIAFTGIAPWSFTYTDGSSNTTVSNVYANPYVFQVSPSSTTTYSLVSVTDGSTCTGGSVSGSAIVTVNTIIPSANTPIDQTRCAGIATIAVSLSGTSGATFNWSIDNSSVGLSPAAGTGTVPAFTTANNTGAPITATVTITPVLGACIGTGVTYNYIINVPPSFTSQPVSNSVCANSMITFTSTVAYATSLQWREYGANISNGTVADGTVFSGVTTTSLSVTPTAVHNNKDYTLYATNACGSSLSNAANLTVYTSPIITSEPAAIFNGCDGGNISSLTVIATGGSLSYQWRENGIDLTNTGIYSGVTTSTLTLTAPTMAQNGNLYSVVVTSSCGGLDTSTNSTLTLYPYLTPSVSISASGNNICFGTNVNFTTSAGNPGGAPAYQWYLNSSPISGAVSSTYASSSLNNGDVITCNMTSNYLCLITPTVSSNSITMAVLNAVTNVIGSDEAVCYNTAASTISSSVSIAGGNGSYGYQWQFSANNSSFANISGANSASYAPGNITSSSWYRRLVTSGACSSTSNSVRKYNPTANFQWTGVTDTDWNTTTNWCSNVIPTATDDVAISSGISNYPVISNTTGYLKNMVLGSGATLTLGGAGNLEISGDWTNNGTFIPYDGSSVIFTANSGTQTIGGGSEQTFYNLEKTGTGTLAISSASNVTIRRGGLLNIAAGTFDINNRTVLLKSKISALGIDSTASLGVVGGSITNASNFKVERYNRAVRGVRYIAASQNNITIAQLKDSIIISGPVSGGFDSPNSSLTTIKEYRENRSATISKGFVSLTSITNTLTPGKGYYLFVPSKRTTVYPATEAVTLLTKGTPVTGNFTFSLSYTPTASEGWNLLGNPYPCAIDWDNTSAWTRTNVDDVFYIWDPNSGASGGYYTYASGIASDARDNGSIITSGQGFFVKANAANPTMSITENAKVSAMYVASNFRKSPASYVTLKVSTQNGDVDYTTIRLDATDGLMNNAAKMANTSLNVYTKNDRGDESYAIKAVNGSINFEVPIFIESSKATSAYEVEITKISGGSESLKIKNQMTGDIIDVTEGLKFEVVPSGNPNLVSLLKLDAGTVVTSTASGQIHSNCQVYPSSLTSGAMVPTLYTDNTNEKQIEIYSAGGEKVGQRTLSLRNIILDEFNSLPSGVYTIKVISAKYAYNFKVVK